jgi:hypothetical protein
VVKIGMFGNIFKKNDSGGSERPGLLNIDSLKKKTEPKSNNSSQDASSLTLPSNPNLYPNQTHNVPPPPPPPPQPPTSTMSPQNVRDIPSDIPSIGGSNNHPDLPPDGKPNKSPDAQPETPSTQDLDMGDFPEDLKTPEIPEDYKEKQTEDESLKTEVPDISVPNDEKELDDDLCLPDDLSLELEELPDIDEIEIPNSDIKRSNGIEQRAPSQNSKMEFEQESGQESIINSEFAKEYPDKEFSEVDNTEDFKRMVENIEKSPDITKINIPKIPDANPPGADSPDADSFEIKSAIEQIKVPKPSIENQVLSVSQAKIDDLGDTVKSNQKKVNEVSKKLNSINPKVLENLKTKVTKEFDIMKKQSAEIKKLKSELTKMHSANKKEIAGGIKKFAAEMKKLNESNKKILGDSQIKTQKTLDDFSKKTDAIKKKLDSVDRKTVSINNKNQDVLKNIESRVKSMITTLEKDQEKFIDKDEFKKTVSKITNLEKDQGKFIDKNEFEKSVSKLTQSTSQLGDVTGKNKENISQMKSTLSALTHSFKKYVAIDSDIKKRMVSLEQTAEQNNKGLKDVRNDVTKLFKELESISNKLFVIKEKLK